MIGLWDRQLQFQCSTEDASKSHLTIHLLFRRLFSLLPTYQLVVARTCILSHQPQCYYAIRTLDTYTIYNRRGRARSVSKAVLVQYGCPGALYEKPSKPNHSNKRSHKKVYAHHFFK
jgi:hypothetical protein